MAEDRDRRTPTYAQQQDQGRVPQAPTPAVAPEPSKMTARDALHCQNNDWVKWLETARPKDIAEFIRSTDREFRKDCGRIALQLSLAEEQAARDERIIQGLEEVADMLQPKPAQKVAVKA